MRCNLSLANNIINAQMGHISFLFFASILFLINSNKTRYLIIHCHCRNLKVLFYQSFLLKLPLYSTLMPNKHTDTIYKKSETICLYFSLKNNNTKFSLFSKMCLFIRHYSWIRRQINSRRLFGPILDGEMK